MASAGGRDFQRDVRRGISELTPAGLRRTGSGVLSAALVVILGLSGCESQPTGLVSPSPQHTHASGKLPHGDGSVTVEVKHPNGDPVTDGISIVLYNETGFQRARTESGVFTFEVGEGRYSVAVLPAKETPPFIAPAHGMGPKDEEKPASFAPVVTGENAESVPLTATSLLESLELLPVVVAFHPSRIHDRSDVSVRITVLESEQITIRTPSGQTVWAAITGLDRGAIPEALRPSLPRGSDGRIHLGVILGGAKANSSTTFSVPQQAEVAFELLHEGPLGWIRASAKKAKDETATDLSDLSMEPTPLVCGVKSSSDSEKGDNTGNIDLWKVFWGFLGDIDPKTDGVVKPPAPQPTTWVDLDVGGSDILKHDTRIERRSGGNLSVSLEWNCRTDGCTLRKHNLSAGLEFEESSTKLSDGKIRVTVWIDGIFEVTGGSNFRRASFGWSVPGDQFPNAARPQTTASLQGYGDWDEIQCSLGDLGESRVGGMW